MQQLTVITVFANCPDHGAELPGTRNTGHCHYKHTQVHKAPLQPKAMQGEPAGHFFCLSLAQNIQKKKKNLEENREQQAQRKRTSSFMAVIKRKALLQRKADTEGST